MANDESNIEELNETEEEVTDSTEAEGDSTEVEEQKVKPQPTVDINQLKKELAAAIRKEEKDKLYKTIEKTDSDLKSSNDRIKELEAKIQAYEDENLSADEKLAKQLNELREANEHLKHQMEEVSTTAAKEIFRMQLETAKEKELAKYGDEIIPELVTGSTIEEIMESAEKAHEKYKDIAGRVKDSIVEQKRQTTTPPPVSPKTSTQHNFDVNVRDVKDPKEWATIKAKLLDQALNSR